MADWIKKAIKNPGALTRQARAEGKTVRQFCADLGPNASETTKRRCNLAKTLAKVRK